MLVLGPTQSTKTAESHAEGLNLMANGTITRSQMRASNALLGRSMAHAYGWGGKEWRCLRALWNRESRWDHYAVNEKSGAYGIPQAMKIPNKRFRKSPAEQIKWGLKYISYRYGKPCVARHYQLQRGWY